MEESGGHLKHLQHIGDIITLELQKSLQHWHAFQQEQLQYHLRLLSIYVKDTSQNLIHNILPITIKTYISLKHAIHTYIHIYIPWINKCVTKKTEWGTSHKYIKYLKLYNVKYYKHFIKLYKTILQIIFTHKKFICRVKGLCI